MDIVNFSPHASEAAIAAAAQAYAQDGFARLEGALGTAAAEMLYEYLAGPAEWWRVVNQGEKVWDLGPESIARLEADGDAALLQAVHAGARDGFQFLYDSVRIAEDADQRAARAMPIDRLLDALNSPEWLEVFRRVTGAATIAHVDGQATRYLPGHFLTGHDDAVAGKQRMAAYVLGLTPRWRTEWGGLLMFHAGNGDVERALMPRFDAIHLFAVPRLHSVSPVAPYAGAARYSVTGWLRAAP